MRVSDIFLGLALAAPVFAGDCKIPKPVKDSLFPKDVELGDDHLGGFEEHLKAITTSINEIIGEVGSDHKENLEQIMQKWWDQYDCRKTPSHISKDAWSTALTLLKTELDKIAEDEELLNNAAIIQARFDLLVHQLQLMGLINSVYVEKEQPPLLIQKAAFSLGPILRRLSIDIVEVEFEM